MSSVGYLTVSSAWRRVNVAANMVFFNSLRGSHVSHSGRIKARMESLKTHVE